MRNYDIKFNNNMHVLINAQADKYSEIFEQQIRYLNKPLHQHLLLDFMNSIDKIQLVTLQYQARKLLCKVLYDNIQHIEKCQPYVKHHKTLDSIVKLKHEHRQLEECRWEYNSRYGYINTVV